MSLHCTAPCNVAFFLLVCMVTEKDCNHTFLCGRFSLWACGCLNFSRISFYCSCQRTFWLWCRFISLIVLNARLHTDMDKVFCQVCGNDTLQRVSLTVDSKGNTRVHIPRYAPSAKGTKVHPSSSFNIQPYPPLLLSLFH